MAGRRVPTERQARALALRRIGRLYREIGAELGVCTARAHQLVRIADRIARHLEARRAPRAD